MKKKALTQIAFEFLSVVFAVLLALGLNSFKQNMDLESEGEFLQEKIIKETKRNLLELDSVLITNKAFFIQLDSLRKTDKLISDQLNISIASELLTRSAWDFTKASRSFSYIDEEFLSEAAFLYESQDYYMTISNQMFEKLGDMLLTDPDMEKVIKLTHYYISNLNVTAENLIKTYQEFLDRYTQSISEEMI
ncbi:hypothetical protein [Ekhidna sp.]